MSQFYTFTEAGSVPGIPGLFAGVSVTVSDDGTIDVQPLPQHPHFEVAPPEEEPQPKSKKQAKAETIEEA